MNKRYKALFKVQISRDPVDWSVYIRLRNDVKKELRMAEANYWSSKLNGTRSGSKGFWNVVKRLTGKSAKSKRIGPTMNEQKELVFEDSKKADTFNVFFSTIGKELDQLFTPRNVSMNPAFYRITPSICHLKDISNWGACDIRMRCGSPSYTVCLKFRSVNPCRL